jgi:hypothetical protein
LVADGSKTVVTGAGTTGDPYIITATEVDGSVSNEIQDLVLTGNNLTLAAFQIVVLRHIFEFGIDHFDYFIPLPIHMYHS